MRNALRTAAVVMMLLTSMGSVGVAQGASSTAVSPDVWVYHPSARFIGPCSRLRYAPVFDNTKSTNHVAFQFTYRSFATHQLVTIGHSVREGLTGTTRFGHVLAGSLMTIRAKFQTRKHVLFTQIAASPGNYPACYAPRGRFHQETPGFGAVSVTARFNNFRSTAAVRFAFIYRSFTTNKVLTIEHVVMPGRRWTTKRVRALVGSPLIIRGHGKVLLERTAGA